MRISDWSSDVCSSDLKIRIANLAKPDLSKLSENLSFPNLEHTIAIVKDRRLYDLVNNGIYPADKVRREVAITVFFRFTAHGISALRSEAHTSELQSLMRISYAVFCLKKTTNLLNVYSTSHVTHQ